MARGLDHIVHAVSDLDAAADFYRRCGFQVGARNRHPWGTHNHIVQLPGFFIEILTVGEPEKLGEDGLSLLFGVFNRDAIRRGDGFSMLVVESGDIDADVADYARSGIGCSPALPFSRQAKLPDGSTATVGFSLAFARDPQSPTARFAACRQQNPEAFWTTAYQRHANGASAVAGVVLVARRPGDHAQFLRDLTGSDHIDTRLAGLTLHTPRGEIEVEEPAAFGDRAGALPEGGEGMIIAGLRIAVDSLDALEHRLRGHNLPTHRAGACLVVPPQAAYGTTLIFEQARLS